jgi:hypothetical protein
MGKLKILLLNLVKFFWVLIDGYFIIVFKINKKFYFTLIFLIFFYKIPPFIYLNYSNKKYAILCEELPKIILMLVNKKYNFKYFTHG